MEPNEAQSSKRKVDFVTLIEKGPSSKTLKIDTSEDTNKLENCDNIVEDKAANSSINQYLFTLKQKMKSTGLSNSEKLVEKLMHEIENLKSNSPNFLKQAHFKNLFDFYANEIESIDNSAMAIKSHEDLLKELHRMSMKLPAPQTVTTKRVDASYIQKLTISLLKVIAQIDKAQSKELSLDDLEQENEFTKLPILYKTALKLWRKRETLMHRCTLTGHHMYAKFEYHGTDNDLVNKIVENLFNQYLNRLKKNEDDDIMGKSAGNSSKIKHKPAPYKHFSFFTIIELQKKLTKAINDNPDIKNFELTDQVLSKIYKDLLSEIKQRRQNSQRESLRVLELSGDNESKTEANDQNSEMKEKLDLSVKRGMEALEELVRIFREKDLQQNKNQNDNEDTDKTLGWDDKDNENEEDPDDSDEAEVIEEDASSSSDYDDDNDNENSIDPITVQSGGDCVANDNEKTQTNNSKDEPEESGEFDEEIAIIEEEDESGNSDDNDDNENDITIKKLSEIPNSKIPTKDSQDLK